jgi:hypothetical protein
MQLARRFNSRIAAGLGLAMAAILLPTAALASSAAAGSHGLPAAAACRAQHIRAWYGLPSDGGAGTIHYWFQVSNIGRSTCTISGRLRITAIDNRGDQVGLAAHSGPRTTVTLKPLGTAYFVLGYIDVAVQCAHPRHATEISVRLPGQAHGSTVPFSTLGCPARSVLDASALHPGAGIPQRSPF